MKKLFILFALALASLCASAQKKGDMAIGLNFGFAPSLGAESSFTNPGVGAKFQYNISNPMRFELSLDYWMENKGVEMFNTSANFQYLVHAGKKVCVYPTVGIGLALVSFDLDYTPDPDAIVWGGYTDSAAVAKILFNIGAGFEYSLSDKFSIGAEVKYQYIDNFSRLPVTVGATYKF